MGTIYALSEGFGSRFIKIGWTSSSEDARVSSLQCGNPRELILIATLGSAERKGEALIHKELNEWHVRREWFAFHVPVWEQMLFIGFEPKGKMKMLGGKHYFEYESVDDPPKRCPILRAAAKLLGVPELYIEDDEWQRWEQLKLSSLLAKTTRRTWKYWDQPKSIPPRPEEHGLELASGLEWEEGKQGGGFDL